MPSLDEMRARKGSKAARPRSTHTVTLVTGQHLLDEQKRLQDELTDLLMNLARTTNEDGEREGPPRKMGERDLPPRAEQIKAEAGELHSRLVDHQGEITLVGALSDGEWLLWKEEHPARDDSVADERIGRGWCNTTDLFNDLGKFVGEWNGEPIEPGDWDSWLAEQIAFADKRDLVAEVIDLYETRVTRAPKSPSSSSGTTPG